MALMGFRKYLPKVNPYWEKCKKIHAIFIQRYMFYFPEPAAVGLKALNTDGIDFQDFTLFLK